MKFIFLAIAVTLLSVIAGCGDLSDIDPDVADVTIRNNTSDFIRVRYGLYTTYYEEEIAPSEEYLIVADLYSNMHSYYYHEEADRWFSYTSLYIESRKETWEIE